MAELTRYGDVATGDTKKVKGGETIQFNVLGSNVTIEHEMANSTNGFVLAAVLTPGCWTDSFAAGTLRFTVPGTLSIGEVPKT